MKKHKATLLTAAVIFSGFLISSIVGTFNTLAGKLLMIGSSTIGLAQFNKPNTGNTDNEIIVKDHLSGFPDITFRDVQITQSIEDRVIQDQTYQLLYSLKEIFNIGDSKKFFLDLGFDRRFINRHLNTIISSGNDILSSRTIDTIDFNIKLMQAATLNQKSQALSLLEAYRSQNHLVSPNIGPHQKENKLFYRLRMAFSKPGEKLMTITALGRALLGPDVREDVLYEGRSLRFPLTEQTWLLLTYKVIGSTSINDKDLALSALFDYGVEKKYTYSPLRPEDRLIKVLHFVFTKQNSEFLTYSQLSQELGLRHSFISDNLKKGGVFYDKSLYKIGLAITNKLTTQFDQDLAYYALGEYISLDREYQVRSRTSRSVWLSRLGRAPSTRQSLYHRDWNNLRATHIHQLMIEQRGLDPLTGKPINLRRLKFLARHHFNYDKSSNNLADLILMYRGSYSRISHARPQTSYGASVIHSGSSFQHQIWLQEAKDAFSKGLPPPHWTDPSHPWHQYVDSQAINNFNARDALFKIWGYQTFFWGFIGNP